MTILGSIALILAIWVAVSIPLALLIGRFIYAGHGGEPAGDEERGA